MREVVAVSHMPVWEWPGTSTNVPPRRSFFWNPILGLIAATLIFAIDATSCAESAREPYIDTIAGDGTPRIVGQPFGVEIGPDGALYICEVENHRIRRCDLQTGVVTTVVGTGEQGYSGDGGRADQAKLDEPYEIRFDSAGNLFLVEMKNHIVRRVDAETKTITTVAGTGVPGYSGDEGLATSAQLNVPHSIALDDEGHLYIADIGNHRIRCVNLRAGTITTIAGNGEQVLPSEGKTAKGNPMLGPRALFVRDRTMWIALREGHSIWTLDLDQGTLSQIAGTGERGYSGDGGPALEATFSGPKGIAVGPGGDIYVVDTENQAIRKIDSRSGKIVTRAGSGPTARDYRGDGGPAAQAALDRPHGVCVGPDGAVYIGDTNNHRVRRVHLPKENLGGLQPTHKSVVPINWDQFEQARKGDQHLAECTTLLLNSARYNLAWIEQAFELDEAGDAYVLTGFQEHGVRPACCVVYGTGVLLKTGSYDAKIVGVSQDQAQERTIRLIRGIVRAHRANRPEGEAWGISRDWPDSHQYWQTALWAALSGMGGWLMWEDLDSTTQQMLVAMLQQESARFVDLNYQVPYWNGDGGDTKAEENSWNSMILALMTAMMPDHPGAPNWKRRCSELMISSYATRRDWEANETMIDGRLVQEWLNGFNALPGGVVINHGFIHPDYMGAISMNFWGLTTQSLAGRGAPQAWDFNAPLIYETFLSKSWDVPPFEKPGGTIYVPGKSNIYYPRGNDWSYHDLTIYYLMDVFGHIYRWDARATQWMKLRAASMLKMQLRHDDRRMFAKGEYDTYPGSEQWAYWCLTDAFLPMWLHAQGELNAKINWLDPVPEVAEP